MWEEAEPATAAALDRARAALERAGAWVDEIARPGRASRADRGAGHGHVVRVGARRSPTSDLYRRAELSPRLAQMLDAGDAIGAAAYDAAVAEAAAARAALGGFFGTCDAMLVPAAPGVAPKGLGNTGDPVFNRMWTLLGHAVRDHAGVGGARAGCRAGFSWSGGSATTRG